MTSTEFLFQSTLRIVEQVKHLNISVRVLIINGSFNTFFSLT